MLTLTMRGGKGSQDDPLCVFEYSEKIARARARPLGACKSYPISHIRDPARAPDKPGHWVRVGNKTILEVMLGAPAVDGTVMREYSSKNI